MSADYQKPSDQQWGAIRATDDHILVAASAGTGKTFTVISKILYLLGVPVRGEVCPTPIGLDDIAAITFTNKAAAELKAKLRDALRKAGRKQDAYRVDGARIGTIHSFCGNILREFALRTGRAPSPQLVDEAEAVLFEAEAVRDALLHALEDQSIDGLNELVGRYTVEKIEKEVSRLLDQGSQLDALIAQMDNHAPREQALLRLAAMAQERIVNRLDEASQIDFDRMIGWTRDLIRDDPTVRRTLQRRIKVLFIDEFQDVDPAQREIAYLLAEPENWRTTTTRLVLVGDPKQSIYRFRHADVTVWRQVARDFGERGWKNTRIVELLENRRSFAPILGFVDHAVGQLLDTPIKDGGGLEDYEIAYSAMTSVRTETVPETTVEFVTIPAKDDGKAHSAGDIRDVEARALAERARELHESGIAWRDIAVLLCGWGAAEVYENALRALGIPTYILRDEGFYGQLEVTDVLVALEAIRQPLNDRALFGFLRSPFIGLTDESLLRISLGCESPCWSRLRELTLPEATEQALLSRGLDLIDRMGSLRDRVSTGQLIETLLSESGYLAHLELLGREGRQRIANLRKLVRIASGMAEGSVGDFLDMVTRQRETEVPEGLAQLYGEQEDVVTITSVHCAKGLEWKVVFWCDLVRTPPPAATELLIGRDHVLINEAEGEQTDAYKDFKAELEAERIAETKRLWYVAATRAKDLLVLSGIPLGSSGRLKGSPAERLLEAFPELEAGKADYVSAHGISYSASVGPLTLPTEVAGDDKGEQTMDPIGDPAALAQTLPLVHVPSGRGRHSATELLAMDRCGRRHWLRYVVGMREPEVAKGSGAEYGNAIRRGLIVHDVLENYEDDVALGVLLEAAIGRWDPDAPAPEVAAGATYRRRLTKNVDAILANPQYRAVFDAPGAVRELGFTQARAVGEYVEGKIDLVAPGDDGYSIVDVKTSECDEEVAAVKAEQYSAQRAAYARAIEAISGRPVQSFGFQFAGAAAHVGGVRTDESRTAEDSLLTNLLQLARGGSRELSRSPAECGFCGYKAAGWCTGAPSPGRPLATATTAVTSLP